MSAWVTGKVSFENLKVEGPKEHELETIVEVKVGMSARTAAAKVAITRYEFFIYLFENGSLEKMLRSSFREKPQIYLLRFRSCLVSVLLRRAGARLVLVHAQALLPFF